MKPSYLILTILFALNFHLANATVRTLNNNTPIPTGHYSTYAAAETASVNGDTIYVLGSATSYGSITISKQITLIGTGHHPDKQNPLVSIFDQIVTANSNIRIIGLRLNNALQAAINIVQNNLYIGRNDLLYIYAVPSVSGSNWIIEGNVFHGSVTNISNFSNIITCTIQNNIFNGTITDLNFCNIYNNIFFDTPFGALVTSCVIYNNIFYSSSNFLQNTNCTTSYNCLYPGPITGDNDGNNIVADPLFVLAQPANFTEFDYNYDYHLQAGSPCITNPGSEGSQRGIYGGTSPIGNPIAFRMGGEPAIPQIRLVNTTPITVPVGQNINVNVISTRKQ